MNARPQQHDDLTPDTIAQALDFIDPSCSREEWARMAMAIKSELGEPGFEIFDAWSAKSDKYDPATCRQTWRSVRIHGGVGVGSLIFEAQQRGFRFTDDRSRLNDNERAERAREREQREAAARAEERQRRGAAAKLANEIWNAAQPCDLHPYLTRKGVRSYGLRVGRWPRFRRDQPGVAGWDEGVLLIPAIDARGRVNTLEGIFPAGQKLFMRDGAKRGNFYMIGTPPGPGGNIVFCEGYATGASIHEATGWCVVVCFDAGNLRAVAEELRASMPAAVFVIAADNDRWTVDSNGDPDNPGERYGRMAAAAVSGRLVLPTFASDEGQPKDFNDLMDREGLDAVRAQLQPPAPLRPANDNAPRDGIETAVAQAVDIFTPFPDINGKGKPLDTITNLDELLRRMQTIVRYNVISKAMEVLIPGAAYSVDNAANASMSAVKSTAKRAGFPTESLGEYMLAIADANPFNPVAQWIESRPWDGTSRLQAFCDTVTPARDHRLPDGRRLRDVLMLRWLVACVGACFEPNGIAHKGVLTFTGTQNKGKTSWFKRLAPADMGVLRDGALLDPSDKDSTFQCVSKWLVELGEVDATFKRTDIAQLKAFISKDSDTMRRPYARSESQYARRTIFFASVNNRKFLHDETGNARWWAIECAGLDYQHSIDMQQLWAEVKATQYDGWRERDPFAPWHLRPDENTALNESNGDHESINPVHEMVDSAFDWGTPRDAWRNVMTATEVATSIGIKTPNKRDVNDVSAYLRDVIGVAEVRRGPSKTRALMMPQRNIAGTFGADDQLAGF